MGASANLFQNFLVAALGGTAVNLNSDTVSMMLLAEDSAPSLSGWTTYEDASGSEVAPGDGYTTGGVALAGQYIASTDPAGTVPWAATTGQPVGSLLAPAGSDYIFVAATAGTTGDTEPAWPTVEGESVTDGTVVWWCAGTAVTYFLSEAATWADASFSTDYAVVYDETADLLISLLDFGGTQSPGGDTFTVNPGYWGWFMLPIF